MKSTKVILLNAVSDRQWIVGSLDGVDGSLSFSAFPSVHDTEHSAKLEASRLADLTPGKSFVWVKFEGGVQKKAFSYF